MNPTNQVRVQTWDAVGRLGGHEAGRKDICLLAQVTIAKNEKTKEGGSKAIGGPKEVLL